MTQTAPTHPKPAPPAAIAEACAASDDKLCAAIDSVVVTGWLGQLATFQRDVTDAERIDQLRALEQLKSAAAAAQARITADLDESVRAAHAARGIPAERQGRGVAGQIALARQESPYKGGRHLGLAKVLAGEMPHTLAALERGLISEWRATLLARETLFLSREHRQLIDTHFCADPTILDGWGDKRLTNEIQKIAYQLDPAGYTKRRGKAESERRVTCRPAPDAMARLAILGPVAQVVAMYAALRTAADTGVATGDGRSHGQLMHDTAYERITGQAAGVVPVEINLVMTDRALLGDGEGSDQPAHLSGLGPVPADLARRLAVSAAEAEKAWLRRLYATPDTGRLIGMDSTRRVFPAGLAKFIEVRDQFCRTPWCDAPIRHIDHAKPHHQHGATSEANGNGLCEQCNYIRQAPGWEIRPEPGPRHTLRVTTPTGHTYRSTAPAPPGHPRSERRRPAGKRARRTAAHRAPDG